MKTKLKLIGLALAASLNINAATILVTDFGTNFDAEYANGFGEFTGVSTGASGTTTFGTGNNDGMTLTAALASPLDMSGYTNISVTAQVDASNASGFTFLFYSAPTEFAAADFLASDFTGSLTTVTKALVLTSGFDPAQVAYYGFNGGTPGGTANFRYTFDRVSVSTTAIPEPSTYAALSGIAVLGFVAYRRRRSAA
jgi:hypothetical protein